MKTVSSLLKKRAPGGNANAKNGWTAYAVLIRSGRSRKIPFVQQAVQVHDPYVNKIHRLISGKRTRIRQRRNGLSVGSSLNCEL
jgi:hypothetical protein